jgi:hypothetical protein
MSRWPDFHELTQEQKNMVTNGVGAAWMPTVFRDMATAISSIFFDEASWQHHDYGYFIGGDEFRRWECDWKFLRAMLRDCGRAWYLVIAAVPLSFAFYLSVALFGAFAFRYGKFNCPKFLRKKK